MTADITLAIAHHLLVFSLAGVLASELALVRNGMGPGAIRTLANVDAAFGLLAGLAVIVGFIRVLFGAKGAAFYVANPIFWTKIAAFLLVGAISLAPTAVYIRWRRRARAGETEAAPDREITFVRRCLVAEVVVFLTIPVWAALMARGVGL